MSVSRGHVGLSGRTRPLEPISVSQAGVSVRMKDEASLLFLFSQIPGEAAPVQIERPRDLIGVGLALTQAASKLQPELLREPRGSCLIVLVPRERCVDEIDRQCQMIAKLRDVRPARCRWTE